MADSILEVNPTQRLGILGLTLVVQNDEIMPLPLLPFCDAVRGSLTRTAILISSSRMVYALSWDRKESSDDRHNLIKRHERFMPLTITTLCGDLTPGRSLLLVSKDANQAHVIASRADFLSKPSRQAESNFTFNINPAKNKSKSIALTGVHHLSFVEQNRFLAIGWFSQSVGIINANGTGSVDEDYVWLCEDSVAGIKQERSRDAQGGRPAKDDFEWRQFEPSIVATNGDVLPRPRAFTTGLPSHRFGTRVSSLTVSPKGNLVIIDGRGHLRVMGSQGDAYPCLSTHRVPPGYGKLAVLEESCTRMKVAFVLLKDQNSDLRLFELFVNCNDSLVEVASFDRVRGITDVAIMRESPW